MAGAAYQSQELLKSAHNSSSFMPCVGKGGGGGGGEKIEQKLLCGSACCGLAPIDPRCYYAAAARTRPPIEAYLC